MVWHIDSSQSIKVARETMARTGKNVGAASRWRVLSDGTTSTRLSCGGSRNAFNSGRLDMKTGRTALTTISRPADSGIDASPRLVHVCLETKAWQVQSVNRIRRTPAAGILDCARNVVKSGHARVGGARAAVICTR